MSDESAAPDAPRDPYRELFERSADAILIIEGETFIDCNDATVKMLRYSRKEDVLKTHPSALSPPFQPDGRPSFEKANEMIAIAFEEGSHRFEWDHKRADGEVFPVEVLLTAVQERGRRVLHVVWRDITERKDLEEKLRQAQKMEAIGKLAGGIAHDFNNLLVALLGHSQLLAELLQGQEKPAEHLHEIRRAGERAADLVRQLLAFGRKQELRPAALDLNHLVLDLRKLLERLIGEDVQLETTIAEGTVVVRADRGQLEQVLLNLAANARDAMPDGGVIAIETERVQLRHSEGDVQQELPDGDYALLRVSDSGVGMDRRTAERAFEPFFTTKEPGQGTGLGLATVYGIVKQSGGSVTLESSPGVGTSIRVLLPLTVEPIRVEVQQVEVEELRGGDETILVAEDDPSVSLLVVRALEARGYRIHLARDGREALDLYERHADSISLLITDVIMPNMGGEKLVAELGARGHRPRVLFISSYTDEQLRHLRDREGDVDIIQKPFDVGDLLRRVRSAIDR
jgi:PAS domain S-box-containing protein